MFYCTVKNTLIIISVCTFCFGRDDIYILKNKKKTYNNNNNNNKKKQKTKKNQSPKTPKVFLTFQHEVYRISSTWEPTKEGWGRDRSRHRKESSAQQRSVPLRAESGRESKDLSPAPHPLAVSLPFPRKKKPSPVRDCSQLLPLPLGYVLSLLSTIINFS